LGPALDLEEDLFPVRTYRATDDDITKVIANAVSMIVATRAQHLLAET
jgi:hypothetical protein